MLYTMSCLADGDWASPKSIPVWSNPSMPSVDNVKKLLFQFVYGRSTKANGREPKSCLGWVFNFKLGCFSLCTIAQIIQARPILEYGTFPRDTSPRA
jgi:hypothetical protein